MNSFDFELLKRQISTRLHKKGPATSETIALELGAPHQKVRFALEELRHEGKRLVTLLPFGLWDVIDQTEKVG